MPGHPDADANGYVAMPRMNPAEDMAGLMSVTRSYRANVSATSASRT
jgi:flagellar basal-body rod protein FlgC